MQRRDSRFEHSALFDLDALMREGTPGEADPFAAPDAMPSVPVSLTPLAAVPCPAPPRRWVPILTTIALILAGSLALAAAGGAAWYATREVPQPTTEPTRLVVGQATPMPSAPTPEPSPDPIETPAPPAPEAATDPAPTPDPAVQPAAEETPRRVRPEPRRPRKTPRTATRTPSDEDRPEPRKVKPDPGPTTIAGTETRDDKPLDEVDRLLDNLRDGAVDRGGPQPPDVVSAPVVLPERLTRKQILHSVKQVTPRVRTCGGAGTYRARLSITPAGRVGAATVTGGDAAGRPCIERHVRGMTFPRFAGDAMSIELPFRI